MDDPKAVRLRYPCYKEDMYINPRKLPIIEEIFQIYQLESNLTSIAIPPAIQIPGEKEGGCYLLNNLEEGERSEALFWEFISQWDENFNSTSIPWYETIQQTSNQLDELIQELYKKE